MIKGSTNFFRAFAFATVVVILLCLIKEQAMLDNIALL
ncbi:putative membrane protein [Bacteroides fragilis str. 1009-4-F |nr:putative membrane protein [Bacteroides fragilis str. Korea 419]EYA27369.1 putative membrane protein [Bacteroides fragilis str. 1009-4-F \